MFPFVFVGLAWILVAWNTSQPSFHWEGKSTAWCLRALCRHICQHPLGASPAVAALRAAASGGVVKLLVRSYSRRCSRVKLSWLGCSWKKPQAVWESSCSGKPCSTRHQPNNPQTGQGEVLGCKLGEAFCISYAPVKWIFSVHYILNICISIQDYSPLTKFFIPII